MLTDWKGGVVFADIRSEWQVDQLDLTKIKATDLLKAHEGNPGKAIRAFIVPAA